MLDGNGFFIVASTGLSSSQRIIICTFIIVWLALLQQMHFFSPLLMQYAWDDAALCMDNLTVSTGTGTFFEVAVYISRTGSTISHFLTIELFH